MQPKPSLSYFVFQQPITDDWLQYVYRYVDLSGEPPPDSLMDDLIERISIAIDEWASQNKVY